MNGSIADVFVVFFTLGSTADISEKKVIGQNMNTWTVLQGVSKKIEQILNRSQFCKKAFGINFFTHADHLDICDGEQ